MPTGTPGSLKCPACHRGQYGRPVQSLGVRPTGRVEERVSRSKHSGHGAGGHGFLGHRGEVECLDCGHKWFSTHPQSGRMEVDR
jgi:hypothetical protein